VSEQSYFSVSYDLIVTGKVQDYDLFVNSSAVKNKQKFVRIFPQGEELTESDLNNLKAKYHQLYVPETQRNTYMRSIANSHNISVEEAATFIKDSAIKYLHKIFDDEKEFSTELLSETIEGCREAVESMIDVLDDYNIDSLRGLIGNLSGHDFYTYDHSINVSMYCITVFRAIKPNATRVELMHAGLGGLLHDLGKLKIPTNILNNPGGLSDEEYEIIKKHPGYGIDLLRSGEVQCSEDIDLETIARIVHEHHENWDGTGYPDKIKEKEIHLLARVCCIADFFDAITTKRSYNEVLPISQAIDVMDRTAGKKLDPKLFKLFAQHVKYSKVQSTKQLKMADQFDPSIPYEELPLEEIEEMFSEEDFGKIRFIDENNKKQEE
jgi:HD-GYP domain-containing protein (c-di-GMP phosphodiesterase class II)